MLDARITSDNGIPIVEIDPYERRLGYLVGWAAWDAQGDVSEDQISWISDTAEIRVAEAKLTSADTQCRGVTEGPPWLRSESPEPLVLTTAGNGDEALLAASRIVYNTLLLVEANPPDAILTHGNAPIVRLWRIAVRGFDSQANGQTWFVRFPPRLELPSSAWQAYMRFYEYAFRRRQRGLQSRVEDSLAKSTRKAQERLGQAPTVVYAFLHTLSLKLAVQNAGRYSGKEVIISTDRTSHDPGDVAHELSLMPTHLVLVEYNDFGLELAKYLATLGIPSVLLNGMAVERGTTREGIPLVTGYDVRQITDLILHPFPVQPAS